MSEEAKDAVMADGEAKAPLAEGEQPAPEKKKRGKPKDENAPKKPKNGYQQFTGRMRPELKETRPELASDLKGMGIALAEEWAKVPQEEKDRLEVEYQKEMDIWRPKWAAYKETDSYKDFVEVKSDWLDIRQRKKLQKTMTKDAPKRPKSGYMIYAGEIREEIMQKVKEQGLGMGAGGSMISERWNALTEAEKAKYGEISADQKKKFDVEFLVYRKGDSFKNYMEAKAKLEAKQGLKKNQRVCFREAPKKAPNAFGLFRRDAMPEITAENERLKKEGKDKMDMAAIAKKCAEMFKEVSEEKKAEYQKEADKLKAEYDEKFTGFKTDKKYVNFIETRHKIKFRENRLLRLRDMPKRPKSVFSMFADDHKSEVPPGKGEGKGRSALKVLFQDFPSEKKVVYENKEKELLEVWKKDLEEFKAGDVFKTYRETCEKVKKEFENEAIKVTTLKFLREAPPACPKTGFAVFLMDKKKREAEGAPEGEKKSKEAKREYALKAKEEYGKLPKEAKQEYDTKRAQLQKDFEQACKDYMATEKWQEYVKEAKRLRIPVKSLLFHKKKFLKKLGKDGKLLPASIPLPTKPDTFPIRAKPAFSFFTSEKKGELVSNIKATITSLEYDKLVSDQTLLDSVKAAIKEAVVEEVGSKVEESVFIKLSTGSVVAAITIVGHAVDSKSSSPLKDSIKAKVSEISGISAAVTEDGTIGVDEVEVTSGEADSVQELQKLWDALDNEGKKKFTDAAAEDAERFRKDTEEFKKSDEGKTFIRETKQAQRRRRILAAKNKYLDAMPKKPSSIIKVFQIEKLKDVKKSNPGKKGFELKKILDEMWTGLDSEEKEKWTQKGKDADAKFQEDMKEFKASANWKAYEKAVKPPKAGGGKGGGKGGAAPSLGGPKKPESFPKKPPNAYMLFAQGKDIKEAGPMWAALDQEQKDEFQKQAKEASDKYDEEKAAFDKSPAGLKYYRACQNFAKQRKLAMAKKRFLKDMPKKPGDAFKIFQEEKRPDVVDENGAKGLKGLHEQNQKLQKLWQELSEEDKRVFQEKAKEANEKYEQDLEEFKKTPNYSRWQAFEKSASGKGMAKAKGKAKSSSGPKVPDNYPKKPPAGIQLFAQEQRQQGKSSNLKQISEGWVALGAEGQKPFLDQAKEMNVQFIKDMDEFKKSAEGKRYLREKEAAVRNDRLRKIKDKYLKGAPTEPKKPQTAYFLFVSDERGKLSETNPKDVAKVLSEKWAALPAEEKKAYEDKHKEAKEQYDKDLSEYKNSNEYKMFQRAQESITGRKQQVMRAKAKAKAVAKDKKTAKVSKGRGGGRGGAGRGRGGAAAAKAKAKAKAKASKKDDSSDSDVMGSDSDDSSTDDSDSD